MRARDAPFFFLVCPCCAVPWFVHPIGVLPPPPPTPLPFPLPVLSHPRHRVVRALFLPHTSLALIPPVPPPATPPKNSPSPSPANPGPFVTVSSPPPRRVVYTPTLSHPVLSPTAGHPRSAARLTFTPRPRPSNAHSPNQRQPIHPMRPRMHAARTHRATL